MTAPRVITKMQRRDFFKIISVSSAGALATACGTNTDELIPLLVPEGQIVPGEEQWHPAVCAECAAGCGTLVRVMEGRRVIEVELEKSKEKARERRAAIKKIEGNPLDPISGGHLCARGQAVVQALYHPDRLTGPQKRSAQRGQAQFASISWDTAITEAADAIRKAPGATVILTGSQTGTRSLALQRFAAALGASAPVVCALDAHPIERAAAERAFGWSGIPRYDLASATHVLSVGADFLGGWVSPVYYARQYGAFRQGRSAIRGRLVHAESRMSLTAASADRWLPLKPGSEVQFLLAMGAMLGGEHFAGLDIKALLEQCGLEERGIQKVVREVAEELAASPAPLVIAGASQVHTNSLAAVIASHWLNQRLNALSCVHAPAIPAVPPLTNHRVAAALASAQVILIDGANPAYTLPKSSGFLDALAKAQAVIGLGSFLDDTAAFADLILPAPHYLEAETAIAPSIAPGPSLTISTPFVRPLHDTRPVEQTLTDLATALELDYTAPTAREIAESIGGETPYADIARQGGIWNASADPAPAKLNAQAAPTAPAANFSGDGLHFQPYLSLQFHDGRASNLPWMQQLPDPATSAMWNVPVEIDPATARQLNIATGDHVRIASPHGSIEAPAYINPAAIPGVVSMAIGGGHTHYTRYASVLGANPLSILAPVYEESTGALVTGGTRVKLTRLGEGRLIQYSVKDRAEKATRER